MRSRLRWPIAACVAALQAVPARAETPAQAVSVYLQGENLAAIREAVVAAGGRVTHDLPIISAIGARIDRAQLDRLRQHPGVERMIDDLDTEADSEPAPDCALAGGLELSWSGSAAAWRLYNKSAAPIALGNLDLAWPDALGQLTQLSIDGHTVDHAAPDSEQTAAISLASVSLAEQATTQLRLRFSQAPQVAPAVLQNQIDLRLHYGNACELKLIPSYLQPADDSYYSSTTGAVHLHSHGITGAGVTVAVLDSGIWEGAGALTHDTAGHPRIIARYDAISDREPDHIDDESGHGSHMTSVIARSDPIVNRDGSTPTRYRGIAPDVSIAVVKAFDVTGEARMLDLIRGVQWIVDNHERLNIRVVNLSFSMRPRWPYWDDPLNQALMRAWAEGLVLVAAAGNEGPEPMTVGSPGNLPYLITVGAITDSWTPDDRQDDYLPDFSSRGPTPSGHIKPDIVSYGGHMTGFVEPGTSLDLDLPEYRLSSGEFVMTGSSQAAAVVSGLAALMLEAEPSLSNIELKCMLLSSAEPAISVDGRLAYSPFAQGYGLANILRALTIGERSCNASELDITGAIERGEHYYGPALFHEALPPSLPDQESLISDAPPERGHSASRRWGVTEHLKRLDAAPTNSPIDWQQIFRQEQARFRELAQGITVPND
jgi:subtilisin family serine protease